MNKVLLLAIGALLSVGTVSVDAKVSLPGFPKEKSQKESRIKTPHKATGVSKLRPVNAPAKMTVAPQELVDKSMLTSYKMTTSYSDIDEKTVEEGTFTYDEYGFPKTKTYSNGDIYTYEYQWVTPGSVWSSRTITSRYGTDTTTRTFHSNGMVASERTDNSLKRYDENGYLIEQSVSYDTNSNTYKFHYFAPTGNWYMSEIFDEYKREYSIDGNSVTLTVMQMMSDGKWYYEDVTTEYYDNEGNQTGSFIKRYICEEGEENIPSSITGNRSLTYTENGKIIKKNESYDQDTDMWNCSYLAITSENYDDPYIYKPGEVRFEEYYYNDTNEDGTLDSNDKGTKYVITWVKDRIMKVEYNDDYYDEHEVYYRLADEDGKDYSSIYYNTDNGSYCVDDWNDDEDTGYYTFFDANHNELEAFRAKEEYNGPDTWEKKNGNTWEKCSGTITVWSGSDDKYVITFDAQGRVIRYEEWEYDVLDEYSTYAYDANGWTRTDYSSRKNSETQEVYFKKTDESGYHTFADGSIEDWYIEYYGTPRGHKDITYPNGAVKVFSYFDGEWSFSHWSTNTKETLLADGYIENISYNVDENGNVSNSRKEIHKNVYDDGYDYYYFESYNWDEQTNSWVGEGKEIRENNFPNSNSEEYMWSATDNKWILLRKSIERESKFPAIDYIAPVDPLEMSDEYFFETEKYPNETSINRFSLSYEWNDEKKELELTWALGEEYTKVSDTEVKITDYSDIWSGIETYSFKLDNKHRVIEYKNQTWAYNDKDQVVVHIINPERWDNSIKHYEYTYTDLKVWDGIESIIGENATVIATYNLSGVAVDNNNLPAGVYVQKLSDGSSRKIVVK